ncbi:MAG: alanine--tRNA ligase, partial [Candidatus Paceibacterota bacterium]
VPYLLGEPHPKGERLVNVQKCLRTIDLSEVGDNTHNTFFEMMGNWSLGDYFKKEAITWSYEFLTSKTEGLGLDVSRLYVTVFAGNEKIKADTESVEIWKSLGIPEHRIYYKNSKSNWWSAGLNSPAGPSSEMFYDIDGGLGDLNEEAFNKAEDEQKVVEIWNDVFMMYRQADGEVVGELPQKNIDTGAGLERITTIMQGKNSMYETDLFLSVIKKIEELSRLKYGDKFDKQIRIVADHIRTAVFIIADGVLPSNTGRGYILRRVLRRATRYSDLISLKHDSLSILSEIIIEKYKNIYPELQKNKEIIKKEIDAEENKFRQTLEKGIREFEKGEDPFILFTTYGFPIELISELAREKGKVIDLEDFNKKLKKHQELSRTASAGMFKGGLVDEGEETKRLHTATHLLNAALRQVLGNHVMQKGSNITAERLRFDFTNDLKMTDEQKRKVEEIINQKIAEKLPVICEEMPIQEAEKIAIHSFNEKYGDIVKVYSVGNKGNYFSREFCGGPHVSNTSELGKFKIQKEEAVSAGVRRIKAVLE